MSYLSASSSNTEVKRTFCTVKIVCAYVRILVAQIRKLTVSLKNGSDEVGISTSLLACGALLPVPWEVPFCSNKSIAALTMPSGFRDLISLGEVWLRI